VAAKADPPAAVHCSAFIGVGANLGDAKATVQAAIGQIAALPQTRLVHRSSLYRTAPVDASGDDYINAVVEISTCLAPLELLHALQRLEQQAGRKRPYRNAPRTLDLDVLLFGELTLNLPELTIPHPRMWQRAFVLVPLAEIAPGRVSAAQLLAIPLGASGQAVEKLLAQ
jgi:2-amino-4-hydroxy-6-hydroxymethyldihydropteridine diphosphokinase